MSTTKNSEALSTTTYLLSRYFKGDIVELKDRSINEMLRDVDLLRLEVELVNNKTLNKFMKSFSYPERYANKETRKVVLEVMNKAVTDIYSLSHKGAGFLYTAMSHFDLQIKYNRILLEFAMDRAERDMELEGKDFGVLATLLERSPRIRECFVTKEMLRTEVRMKTFLETLFRRAGGNAKENTESVVDKIVNCLVNPDCGDKQRSKNSTMNKKNKQKKGKVGKPKQPTLSFAEKMLAAGITDESVMHKTNGAHEHIEYPAENMQGVASSLKITQKG